MDEGSKGKRNIGIKLKGKISHMDEANTLKEKSKLKLITIDYSKGYPVGGVREVITMPATQNTK